MILYLKSNPPDVTGFLQCEIYSAPTDFVYIFNLMYVAVSEKNPSLQSVSE